MKNLILLLFILISFSCSTTRQLNTAQFNNTTLVKIWESDTTLLVPESVLPDEARKVLYVSNIDGKDPWGKDGKGSIARLDFNGKILQKQWIQGLNAPKGMGMYKGKLYIADLTDLVIVDIAQGEIETVVPISAAQGLNDITIGEKGQVYISDSKGKMVYQYQDGQIKVILKQLKGPNGLLYHNNALYVLDAGGLYSTTDSGSLKLISDGMAGGTDGVEPYMGNYLVSAWAGSIWIVSPNGEKKLLLDTRDIKYNTADIGIRSGAETIIYVPTFWKNSVVAYRIEH